MQHTTTYGKQQTTNLQLISARYITLNLTNNDAMSKMQQQQAAAGEVQFSLLRSSPTQQTDACLYNIIPQALQQRQEQY